MKFIRNIPRETVKELKKKDEWPVNHVLGNPIVPSGNYMPTVKQLQQEGLVGIYEINIGENLED